MADFAKFLALAIALLALAAAGALRLPTVTRRRAACARRRRARPRARVRRRFGPARVHAAAAPWPRARAERAESASGARALPRIQLARFVLDTLVRETNAFRERNPDLEVGHLLVGKVLGRGAERELLVDGLIGSGPRARFSPAEVEMDREYQREALRRMRTVDPFAGHIGDAHLHPGKLDRPSGGDYRTDRRNVLASSTQEMVFAILTADFPEDAGGARRPADCLRLDGLKVSFFYLGLASGYRYRQFVPEVVESVARSEDRPAATELSRVLGLPEHEARLARLSPRGQAPIPCVELVHRRTRRRILIGFPRAPGANPIAFVDTGAEMLAWESPLLSAPRGARSWFPGLLEEVERELAGDAATWRS
ncbi:MAG: hypothetical protein HYZ53_07815 [Planctomycetes bacterium]|nr:hypothetical protein [Planctomycetota bacterium]